MSKKTEKDLENLVRNIKGIYSGDRVKLFDSWIDQAIRLSFLHGYSEAEKKYHDIMKLNKDIRDHQHVTMWDRERAYKEEISRLMDLAGIEPEETISEKMGYGKGRYMGD